MACEPKLFLDEIQVADYLEGLTDQPLISILLPAYNSDLQFLGYCLDSVSAQHYPNWELCIVDDCSSDKRVLDYLRDVARRDRRVKLKRSEKNGGISAASNLALGMAEGEFIVLLDHDDELHRFALLEVVMALNGNPELDLIYSDEDKLDQDGNRVCPAFKPDFDLDVMLAFDYLGHLVALRREIAEQVGGFRESCTGAQDWDLLLRAIEQIDARRIHHIAKPLYHWRMHPESTALNLHAKPYVRKAWSLVLGDYLARANTHAEVEPGLFFGSMRSRRKIAQMPRVAVFFRVEDGAYQAAALVPNLRGIYVTFYELLGSSVTLVGTDEFAPVWSLEEVDEEVLLFVNRPLESVNHLFLEELVAQAMREDCGLVTGLSVDSGRTVHTGLIRSGSGELIDPFVNLTFPQHGYLGLLSVVREVETISDEYFAVRRDRLARIGGLGCVSASFMPRLVELLTVSVHRQGQRVLVTPYAVATLEGVWPAACPPLPREGDNAAVVLNPNFACFANRAEVLSGNI